MVRLTDSLGQITVYRHAIVVGERRLLEVRGPGCASCAVVAHQLPSAKTDSIKPQ
jgi:hypothetical protein